jgi:hypothetical protein
VVVWQRVLSRCHGGMEARAGPYVRCRDVYSYGWSTRAGRGGSWRSRARRTLSTRMLTLLLLSSPALR